MDVDLKAQTPVRLPPELLQSLNALAKTAGQRRAAYVRSIVLTALSTGLPAMALSAAGGTSTKGALLSVRFRDADFKRLGAASRKAGVTTSEFLRIVIVAKAAKARRKR